jgi:hypothetical protein
VQSVPGLSLSDALAKLTTGELKTTSFELIIIAVGGNDLDSKDIGYIMQKYRDIMRLLQETPGLGKLAFSMIVPRSGTMAFDKKRCDVNSFLKRMCKDLAITYIEPMKGVTFDQMKKSDLFNKDNIHLNKAGVEKMKSFYTGAVAAHLIGTPGQRKSKKV